MSKFNLIISISVFVAVIMFLISWSFTIVSLALAGLIYYYVSIKGKAGDWGDGFKSAYFQLALRSLRTLGGNFLAKGLLTHSVEGSWKMTYNNSNELTFCDNLLLQPLISIFLHEITFSVY